MSAKRSLEPNNWPSRASNVNHGDKDGKTIGNIISPSLSSDSIGTCEVNRKDETPQGVETQYRPSTKSVCVPNQLNSYTWQQMTDIYLTVHQYTVKS